jgi:large subunit ribosomal protein L3
MMEGIVGRKIGMSRIFNEAGQAIPVTVIEAGPCLVVQIKTVAQDGYESVQLGFGQKRKNLFTQPLLGHFAKAKLEPKRILKEVRTAKIEGMTVGQEVKVDIFSVGEKVKVTGISKGLGFQGTMRRHNFRGGPKTHGQSDRMRAPGSVGSSSYPSRTFKGQRMSGRMGGDKITIRNLVVVGVDLEKNMLLLKGAVPGKQNSYLTIRKLF